MFKMNRCCERPEAGYAMDNNAAMYQNVAMTMPGCEMPPVYECPQERVCHKETLHNVQHIVPINTRVINHHIYRHTYVPCYTSCEEDVVCNVYDGCPNNF